MNRHAIFAMTAIALLSPSLPATAQSAPHAASAIMVQVKCKPGAADLWQAEFEKEIVPSIEDAVARHDGYTKFTWYETALPYQPFDFVLVYESNSFSQLDAKRPIPHFAALARRVGPARAQQILSEMGAWEADARITLVRAHSP
jgi:hypothetical protein